MTPKQEFFDLITKAWTSEQVNFIREIISKNTNERNDVTEACPEMKEGNKPENSGQVADNDDYYLSLCGLFYNCRKDFQNFKVNIANHNVGSQFLKIAEFEDIESSMMIEYFNKTRGIIETVLNWDLHNHPNHKDNVKIVLWNEVIATGYERSELKSSIPLTEYRQELIDKIACAIFTECYELSRISEKIEQYSFFSESYDFISNYDDNKLKLNSIDFVTDYNPNTGMPAAKLSVTNKVLIDYIIKCGLSKSIYTCPKIENIKAEINKLVQLKKKFPMRIIRRICIVLFANKIITETTSTKSALKISDGKYLKLDKNIGAAIYDLANRLEILKPMRKGSDEVISSIAEKSKRIGDVIGRYGKTNLELGDSYTLNDVTSDYLKILMDYAKRLGYSFKS